jgi:hypothetical protein
MIRLLAALGLRRSVILACLLVLFVTAYGVAEDLGLIQPPPRRPRHARSRPLVSPGRAGPRPPTSPPGTCGSIARPAPAIGFRGRW